MSYKKIIFHFLLVIFTLLFVGDNFIKNKDRVVVAVLDTGIDFKQSFWNHEITSGINMLEPKLLPQDDNGHGTNVSWVIKNLEPQLEIMPIKVIPKSGFTEVAAITNGIYWAANNGAKIINISAGIISEDKELFRAIKYAEDKNVIIIAAAGNEGFTDKINYPAAFSDVISVGAVDSEQIKLPNSNSGPSIDVVAIGNKIKVKGLSGKSQIVSGTSIATPIVTAVVGELLLKSPYLNNEQVRNIIQNIALDINGPGWDPQTGYGLIIHKRNFVIE